MAEQLRKSKQERLDDVKRVKILIFGGSFNGTAQKFNGVADVGIDNVFILWHESRRLRQEIVKLGDISGIATYAQEVYEEPTLDLQAMIASAAAILVTIQDEIGVNILDLGAGGVVRAAYCRCIDDPNGPFFNPVTPAQYAQMIVLINQLRTTITIDVP